MHHSNTTTPTQSSEKYFQSREIKGVRHHFFFMFLPRWSLEREICHSFESIGTFAQLCVRALVGLCGYPCVSTYTREGDVHALLKGYTAS